jgi:hypothetical protein
VVGIGKLNRTLPSVVRTTDHTQSSTGARVVDIGWCERVALPELGVPRLKAKIDTGARTSALHVVSMRPYGHTPDGRPILDVEIPSGARGRTRSVRVEIREFTQVRDSGGHAERRPVVETLLVIGGHSRRVRVSLTDRGDMLFPMLVGRTALPAEFRIHPNKRFLLR